MSSALGSAGMVDPSIHVSITHPLLAYGISHPSAVSQHRGSASLLLHANREQQKTIVPDHRKLGLRRNDLRIRGGIALKLSNVCNLVVL